ncbi:Glutamate--tRNA ligase mitochondrial [Yamadazyma tenuis]|uniref:Glutamate--tRNA ligase mitochondrial n=1 Tax=Candida tenuis TaxID=2315449 RepID=UPI0027A5D0B0|nr:Glutamate--tRNA ligase mitochondrial [Yamadazyma tenuis]
MRLLRHYSKFSLKSGTGAVNNGIKSVHPHIPAVTRFAPSPTGYLHLGSLRTALYNYLLARNTNGKFILRLEDTDQTRLVAGAEKNIYDTLKWCGIQPDEGPVQGGIHAPYRQSERKHIYKEYADQLVAQGKAYHCYCSKERLGDLRESAMKLKPPTTVTYDRKCFHSHSQTSDEQPVIRFKSPEKYDKINDVVHGILDLQPQYNSEDRRYDDFVILKSDGLPTYHFANIVDDHLMGITHVIRGEEWLTSTPKHQALYQAFGWTPPEFVHIPLLTSLKDKKLSKRDGIMGVLSMSDKVLPEALINFVALFGWSPPRPSPGESVSEVMSMDELVEKFSLDGLTRGNAKVSNAKLYYFNKEHLHRLAKVDEKVVELAETYDLTDDTEYMARVLKKLLPSMSSLDEINNYKYLFTIPDYNTSNAPPNCKAVLMRYAELEYNVEELIKEFKKKEVFQSIRFALSNGAPGLAIPEIIDLLTLEETKKRVSTCIKKL